MVCLYQHFYPWFIAVLTSLKALRVAPTASLPTSTSKQAISAPSAPGLPDTLRSKLSTIPPTTETSSPHLSVAVSTSTHPLESRLLQWRSTQHALKMEGLRRTFGIAEPVRRGMELSIVRQGEWRPHALGGSAGVSGDILEGRDWECGWEDVFTGISIQSGRHLRWLTVVGNEDRAAIDVHPEMELKLKMNL